MRAGGWLRRVGPWVGVGTSPAAMMMGGGLAQGIAGWRLIVALLLGTALLAALAGVQGVVGQRSRKPLLALTGGPLGTTGSRRLASPAMLAMMLGWFALNTSVAGTALGRLIGLPDGAGMALFALAMLAVTWFGVDALSWGALAAGVATVLLAVEGIRVIAGQHPLTLLGASHVTAPMGVIPGLAVAIGYGAAFALRAPDFTSDLRRSRQVVWCAIAGLALPLAVFGAVGAALQRSTGTWNLADVLRDLGSPTIAYLFVAIGFSGSVMSNLHSGSLSLTDIDRRVGYRTGLVAMAVVGTALASLHFSRWMLPYLTTIGLAAPALTALCWLHVRRREPTATRWRPEGIAGWGAGLGAGLGLQWAGSGLALPIGFLTAGAVDLLLNARPRAAATAVSDR